MDVLIILNDAPYGQERTFHGLRMADARFEDELLHGARIATLGELTLEADEVLVF